MPAASLIKPTHKAIKQYYQSLQEYSAQKVTHEGAVETAFQRLLDATARVRNGHLVPKLPLKRAKDKHAIAPDGTLRDLFNARCGYWEAKDTHGIVYTPQAAFCGSI